MKNKLRPALRYHGGKWMLANWIISHFPPHKIYVEPFGGGASVLLRKTKSYAEVYNELDQEIVNVFQVARDNGPELQKYLKGTPFARVEFFNAYEESKDKTVRAANTIIKSFMGFGSDSIQNKSGFRANSHRSGTTPAGDWVHYGEAVHLLTDRLKGVVIENRDALDVITQHDREDTLFYVDPPYVHSTRVQEKPKAYRFEMTDEQHIALADLLHKVKGKVVLSGYSSPLYERLYRGWARTERNSLADGARPRVEVIWANFNIHNKLF